MDYDKMTDNEYDSILTEVVKENASILITIPGVYEAVSEFFNNDVLDRWAENDLQHCMECEQDLKSDCGEFNPHHTAGDFEHGFVEAPVFDNSDQNVWYCYDCISEKLQDFD